METPRAAAELEDLTLLELSDGEAVPAFSRELENGEYATLAASSLAGVGSGAVVGDAALSLTGVSAERLAVYNASMRSAVTVEGTVELTASGGVFGAVFAGGMGDASAAAASVKTTLRGVTVVTAFYGGGANPVTGGISVNLTAVTMGGYFYGGTGSYNAATACGNVSVTVNSGDFSCQFLGGSRVGGDGSAALESTVEAVAITLAGGTFTNYVFGGGAGVGGGAGAGVNVSTVLGGTSVTLAGAVVKHEIYAGGLGSCNSSRTAVNGAALVENGTVLNVKSGGAVNIYGGGYAYCAESTVRGGAFINLTGLGFRQGTAALTVGSVYGGGSGFSASGLPAVSAVYGGTTIRIGGSTITSNVITIGSVYGGGNGSSSAVYGGVTIEFAGNFTGINADKLVITGSVSGGGRNGAVVEGEKTLKFSDFQGTLTANLRDFDKISADGYTQAILGGENDFGEVAAIDFDFSRSEPLSGETAVLKLAGAASLPSNAVFSLEFEARSAAENTFTLLECGNAPAGLDGMEYTITDSLYGDSFSAAIGDGARWEYYGLAISMENADGKLLLKCSALA